MFWNFFHNLTLFNQKTFSNPACYSNICFLCFTWSIDCTSHYCYLYIKIISLNHCFYLICQANQIYICPTTRRT